jgi:signal transduction histidine kinase
MEATAVVNGRAGAPSDGRRSASNGVIFAADAFDRDGAGTSAESKSERLLEFVSLQDPDWLLAHELETAVSAILGFLDLLDARGLLDDPEVLRAFLVSIRNQATDFASVVSEIVCLECTDTAPQAGRVRGGRDTNGRASHRAHA